MAPSAKGQQENELYAAWLAAEDKAPVMEELYKCLVRHAARVMWLLVRRTDADVIHDTVSEILTDLHNFTGKSQFSTWSHSHIRFSLIDWMRKERKFVRLPDSDSLPFLENTMDDRLYLQECIDGLSDREREVLMSFMEGNSPDSQEQKTGLTGRGVRKILQRIRTRNLPDES